MKKRQIKNLQLNKKSISNLATKDVNGKGIPTLGIICTASFRVCTRWEGCDLPTIGHDDGSICLSQEADWCGGR
ncbi:hypothetical protein KORDIASMS9_04135 [Kordia sp. SMS9]|uniref:hypothetical protein n=1 Tax=Kordia sp. SMS9 TaxID=2282170 RepID=UPI000E0DA5EE|nr:hypothetical protein [Kordia sp. SMS9]AXG71877.1 hypothetical protein KORDIASMS9_04135 [Kordia sp. SMS9]